jgi:hypothetical protein
MKYSPLAVHCTSLCLDMVSHDGFTRLSESDINAYYPDVYQLVYERLNSSMMASVDTSMLSVRVARKIMSLLCHLSHHPEEMDSWRILYELDQTIHSQHRSSTSCYS